MTRDLPLEWAEIETPMAKMKAPQIAGKKLVFAPILRAGLALVEGMLDLVPAARVAHIGLYRDRETHTAVEYYLKTPADLAARQVIVVSPVIATANTAVAAIDRLKERGATDIRVVLPDRLAGGRRATARHSPGREIVDRRDRRASRCRRFHHSGSRRCRRPCLRHQIAFATRLKPAL